MTRSTTRKAPNQHLSPLPRRSLAGDAASRLRQAIVAGEIATGESMTEEGLAARLGISRVPIREALIELEKEGLVEFDARGRTRVRTLTAKDFEELFLLRVALEPLAARLAAPAFKADASRLERNIDATRKAKTLEDITRLDMEFHEIIFETSGNGRLLKLWRSLRCEIEIWLRLMHGTHQRLTRNTLRDTIGAHQAIVTAFQTQSAAACERLMQQHILGWRDWLPTMEVKP
jgi:DNA-binding GntR family transcriptional regulator